MPLNPGMSSLFSRRSRLAPGVSRLIPPSPTATTTPCRCLPSWTQNPEIIWSTTHDKSRLIGHHDRMDLHGGPEPHDGPVPGSPSPPPASSSDTEWSVFTPLVFSDGLGWVRITRP